MCGIRRQEIGSLAVDWFTSCIVISMTSGRGDEEEGEGGKRPAATVAADSSALALVRIVLDCIMSGCIVFVILSFCHLRQIGAVCVSGGFVCIPSETMPGSSASNRV